MGLKMIISRSPDTLSNLTQWKSQRSRVFVSKVRSLSDDYFSESGEKSDDFQIKSNTSARCLSTHRVLKILYFIVDIVTLIFAMIGQRMGRIYSKDFIKILWQVDDDGLSIQFNQILYGHITRLNSIC